MGTDFSERQSLLGTSEAEQSLRRRQQFNVAQLGGIFCLLFTAFSVVQALQTKLNADLGLESLSTLYGCFSLSGFIAGFVVKKLGERVTLFIGATAYVGFVAANLYPQPWLLLPASAYLGFGAAILWAAQGSYVAKCSTKDTLGSNSGLFFAFFMLNSVIGYLITGGLLLSGNSTHFLIYVLLAIGGVANLLFLTLRKPPTLEGPLAAAVVVEAAAAESTSQLSILAEIFVLFKQPKMLLMILPLLYSGFSQSFFLSAMPSHMPLTNGWFGWIMAWFGLSDTLGSIVFGRLSDRVGKKPVLAVASLFTVVGAAMALVYLGPERLEYTQEKIWPFFIIMACLGLSDAGYNTQLYAIHGMFQPDRLEASYAFLKLFQSSSTALAFLYTLYLPSIEAFVILLFVSLGTAVVCLFFCDRFVAPLDAQKETLDGSIQS